MQLAEIQRSRVLAGAVAATDELGYAQATVEQITARVGISRRTFYELFDDRETCLLALVERTTETVEDELAARALDGAGWRERMRGGLEVILSFLDREPALARVCVVQALRAGPRVLERREQILARLAATIDAGRGESPRGDESSPLVAEGLVGAAVGILYTRLLRNDSGSLSGLQGELMSMIVLPYLGPAAARRELNRPTSRTAPRRRTAHDPLRNLPSRLTFRTARVLDGIAESPGACNRAIAEHAGIPDAGQISKLLARLERHGLIENGSEGHAKGRPNAWSLTATGRQVAQSIRVHAGQAR
jgi:AcrR family transcriptional regulator